MLGRRGLPLFRQIVVGFFFLLPVILIGLFGYRYFGNMLPEYTEAHLQLLAKLGSNTLNIQLSDLIDLGRIFSTKVVFREMVAGGKWQEAMALANALTEIGANHVLDRVFLLNIDGVLMAESSPESASIVGRDFSYRDYYKGVSANWQAYVSGVFQKIRPPQYNAFAVSIPIPDAVFKDRLPVGILGLSVQIDRFLGWVPETKLGSDEAMYIVDQKGYVVVHSKLPTSHAFVDFGSVPVVQKVLKGESGVERFTDPQDGEQKLAAYEPIPSSGWGIVVEKKVDSLLSAQNDAQMVIRITFGATVLYCGYLVFRVIRAKK